MDAPKLFISYSWSNEEHEKWVINLATELLESGIDVKLDKWDLKVGHNSITFMEKMVSDKNINKVLIVCDEKYAQKSDNKIGGVGTESQIISSEVYKKQEQEKFVVAVTEKDSEGNPFLPIYYKDRLYIDFTNPDSYKKSLEDLVRWVFDKPKYVKPKIGLPPDYVQKEEKLKIHKKNINNNDKFFAEVKNKIFQIFRDMKAEPDHCFDIQFYLVNNYAHNLNPKQRKLLPQAVQAVIDEGFAYVDIRGVGGKYLVLTEKGYDEIY